MDIKKLIKKYNDFILGVSILVSGIFLVTSRGITGRVISKLGGYWAQPDTYIRLLGWGLIILSCLLILSSVNFTMKAKVEKFRFDVSFEAVITAVALIIYCFIMPVITFFPATFLLVFGLNVLYKRKEAQAYTDITENGGGVGHKEADDNQLNRGGAAKSSWIKGGVVSAVYSLCVTAVMWFVFAKILSAVLP